MVEFENPFAFLLLLLIPVLYFLRYTKIFRGFSFKLTLGDFNGKTFYWKKKFRDFVSVVINILCIAGFVCVVASYANPIVHHQKKVYVSHGTDLLFVIDVSPSMAAKDIGGIQRIEAAKQCIKSLSESNEGFQLGLVEMAKDASLVVPLTLDYGTFFDRLNNIVIGEMGDGTAIGIGLSSAVYHLADSSAPNKVIILITDGENNAGSIHPYTAAKLIKDQNISFYVLGVGTKGTVPVEYIDPETKHVYSGFLESDYDVKQMSQLAKEGNGKFIEAEDLSSLQLAINTIGNTEAVVQSYTVRNFDESYYTQLLLLAGVFFLLAWILRRLYLQEVL